MIDRLSPQAEARIVNLFFAALIASAVWAAVG